jgi:hypothetical protein
MGTLVGLGLPKVSPMPKNLIKSLFANEDWSGLKALGRIVAKVGAATAMAVVGAVTIGFFAGVITIFVYGLGAYLGIGVGLVGGAVFGWKAPLWQTAVVAVAAGVGWFVANTVPARSELATELQPFTNVAGFSIFAVVALATVRTIQRQRLPRIPPIIRP